MINLLYILFFVIVVLLVTSFVCQGTSGEDN